MTHTHSAGAIVFNTKGDILLVHENDNFWGFPKGHIETGEQPEDAVLREIAEETGLIEVKIGAKLGTYARHPYLLDGSPDMTIMKHITMFVASTLDHQFTPTEPAVIPHWVKKDAVASLLTHPQDKAFFLDIRDTL